MGQGVQPYLGDRLAGVSIPVLLIAGALDPGYVTMAEEMHRSLQSAELVIVPNAGHSVVGERPETVARMVDRFVAGRVWDPGIS